MQVAGRRTASVIDCIFCQIIDGKAEVSTAYEDDTVIAIMTIGPINPGHMMVIPRKHFASMRDMDEDTGMHLFKITLRMEQAIRNSGVRCEGINLFLADGEAALQDVFHLHMHVCCQSAKVGRIGTRENYCYGEPALNSLTVLL
jgi:diadenosine tetraphosphate (Ap4A) HIT family hydrolase